MALFVTKQSPAILVRNSEETLAAILPGLPRSFAWLDASSPCCKPLGRAVVPLHSLLTPIHAFRAYI